MQKCRETLYLRGARQYVCSTLGMYSYPYYPKTLIFCSDSLFVISFFGSRLFIFFVSYSCVQNETAWAALQILHACFFVLAELSSDQLKTKLDFFRLSLTSQTSRNMNHFFSSVRFNMPSINTILFLKSETIFFRRFAKEGAKNQNTPYAQRINSKLVAVCHIMHA